MKIYKYIGVALMVLALGACKTDDLERDIDALKDRVTAMEAKVDRLNESMNMIRVALDGNKTIQSYTENEDGSYTLTLSDGNTITLTQGKIGATDVYQEVSISTDGNWVIGGVETEHRALAVDGEPGVTPQFRLTMESEGKYYWEVSYDDNHQTWEEVKNQQGTRVYASASGSSSVAGPIASAAPNATEDKFEITLTGSGTKYEIPIVSDLACAITKPTLEEGFWIVPTNTETTTPIVLKGEAVLISAPEGWTVTAEIGNGTLTIIPPAQDGAEGIITLQVNKGIYWAIDQIKVRSKKVITSWKAEYELGDGFYIGDELVSKKNYPGGTLIENGGTIPVEKGEASGVYFIAGEANISISSILATTGDAPLVIVGDDPNNPPTVTFTGNNSYLRAGTQNLLCKNVKFVRDGSYLFHVNTSANVNKVIFDQCEMELNASFAYTNSTTTGKIEDFQFVNNKVRFDGAAKPVKANANFVNLGTKVEVDKAEISNNIFYSKSKDTGAAGQFFTVAATTIKVEKNTFCNYIQNGQGIKAKLTGEWSVRYNIFYSEMNFDSFEYEAEKFIKNTSYLIYALAGSTFPASNDAFESNVAYNAVEENATAWNVFTTNSMKPSGDYNAKIPQEEESPLRIVGWEKGEFVSLKAGYGATID